jgi:parvulin-like peptidyl-prolyl isomerase
VAVAVLGGCRKEAAPAPPPATDADPVIATYTGGEFRRSDVAAEMERRLGKDAAQVPVERRREVVRAILERRTAREQLYRDALAKGIQDRPDVKARIAREEERLLAEDWLEGHVAAAVHASPARIEEEVKRRTQGAAEELRKFSHIFLKAPEADAPARQRARDTMEKIQKELAEGTPFEDLAKAYSDSITARGGGKVEWTARKPLHPAAAEVVFSLSEGQVSEPVESESGLHLFRLDGIQRAAEAGQLRGHVERLLNDEARRAAIAAERDRVFDQSGVRLDAKALAPGAPADAVVAVVGGDTIRRRDLDALGIGASAAPPKDLAKAVVVDKILAARRRAEPIGPELQKSLEGSRRGRVVGALLRELEAAIPTEVTPQEEAEFYAKHRDTALFLKEQVLDFVFFEQQGPSAADVYGAGERVSKRLREGESFERILDSLAHRPGTVVRKRLAGVQMQALRAENGRIGKAMAMLPVGEVSRAIYLDGLPVRFGQKSPVIPGKGLIFFRIAETRPFALEAVRGQVQDAVRAERKSAVIAKMHRELSQRAGLTILQPAG